MRVHPHKTRATFAHTITTTSSSTGAGGAATAAAATEPLWIEKAELEVGDA